MNNTAPIISVENLLVKRGGAQVLTVPHLQIDENSFLSLIGPNGAGKSSLLLALAFLIKKSSGEISFRGQKIIKSNDVFSFRRKIAMVFQEPLLLNTTVGANISAGLTIRGKGKSEISEAVDKYADMFGIHHLLDRRANNLSGGEAQRTSLARAFAVSPEIIFLDEPFTSLDPPTKEALIDDLQRILCTTKTTVVMATHERNDALRLSDQIAIMNYGEIIQQDEPEAVLNRPANEFIASFVGVESIIAGVVKESHGGEVLVNVAGKELEALADFAAGEKVYCCLRPENVTVSRQIQGKISARNILEAKIEKIELRGAIYKLSLDCGFPLAAYITRTSLEDLSLQAGQMVFASFKATALHVIRRGK